MLGRCRPAAVTDSWDGVGWFVSCGNVCEEISEERSRRGPVIPELVQIFQSVAREPELLVSVFWGYVIGISRVSAGFGIKLWMDAEAEHDRELNGFLAFPCRKKG